MKRFALLLTLAATMAADCPGGDDPTGPADDGDLVGTWALQSVNNDPLPAQWQDGQNTVTVTAGTITVNQNLSFTYSETAGGQVDNTTGTCALTTPPRTYTCDPAEQPGESSQTNGTAVVNGNSMTLTVNETGAATVTRVYSRN